MIRVNLLRPVFAEARETVRWERSADRANERSRRKAPLFFAAGLVPIVTAAERKAKLGGAHRRAIEHDRERLRVEAEKGAEFREQVRLQVSAEKFAELEGRRHERATEAAFWGSVLDALLDREVARIETAPSLRDMPEPPSPPQPQVALFGELPGGKVVPLVAEGHALPLEQVAAEHGVDLTAPELPDPPPCPDCGWVWRPYDKLAFNIHSPGCPGLRAVLLGLRENCADCKARRKLYARPFWGPCDAHRARTLACATDGCIPGPSDDPDVKIEICTRCRIYIGAPAYLGRKEAA